MNFVVTMVFAFAILTVVINARIFRCGQFKKSVHCSNLDMIEIQLDEFISFEMGEIGNNTTNFTEIEKIIFINIAIEFIPFQIYSTLTNIKNVAVQNTRIPEMQQSFFQSHYVYNTLEEFSCYQCGIKLIHDNTFRQMKNLRNLYLNENSIKNINAALIINNNLLRTFAISSNNIATIEPTTFDNHPMLSTIIATNNMCVNNNSFSYKNIGLFNKMFKSCFFNWNQQKNGAAHFKCINYDNDDNKNNNNNNDNNDEVIATLIDVKDNQTTLLLYFTFLLAIILSAILYYFKDFLFNMIEKCTNNNNDISNSSSSSNISRLEFFNNN